MTAFDRALEVIEAMNREGVEYVMFGAMALAAHGLVRATEDADFFIAPEGENIERLKKALRSIWDDPQIEEISADDLLGDYPSVAYFPPDESISIDFLTRLGEAYSYAMLQWEEGLLDGIPVRVVTPRTLYEMKRDTVRYKDRIDADALRRKFGFSEP
ncbi:MAG: nucleotidyl transferase AbiEii/AbiGii toxin family protein [Acidobacteria bacterium]|nr:nucleotidyl transferase AbiEii/AbiGii toxin family protein [Acidobacteriota bacterium]